ncbi:MAG: T9SS type A sorting domain-containing protein [Flavobacteriales bacterium]|nr:T9SS type A sorting domain-containing protein [Flavobacteriales bacterium]
MGNRFLHNALWILVFVLVSNQNSAQSITVLNVHGTCTGSASGFIEFEISGNFPPYQVSWSNGVVFNNMYFEIDTMTSLSPGNYTVSVMDFDLNVDTMTITVPVSAPILSGDIIIEDDQGDCSGIMTVDLFGGFGSPYTYQWSSESFNSSVNQLCEGDSYEVLVIDNGGCEVTLVGSVGLAEPPEIVCENYIEGTLLGGDNLISSGTVYLVDSEDSTLYLDSTSNILNGSFSIKNICNGEYKLTGVAPGYSTSYYNSQSNFNDAFIFTIDSSSWFGVNLKLVVSNSIEETVVNGTSFKVYPNPSKGLITFGLPEEEVIRTIQVFNIAGERVGFGEFDEINQIDISLQSEGMYFIHVRTSDRIYSERVLLLK